MSNTPTSGYIMGHTDHERRRLALQASVLNPFTHEFLRQAGLSAGMRVLDFGCGVGEVSLIAARLAGPHGRVTGLDIDADALAVARARADQEGLTNVTFVQGDIAAHEPARSYDAVIGRHILIHTQDPLAILKRAVALLNPGGVVAFQEYDFSFWAGSHPALPITGRHYQYFCDLFAKALPHPNIGMRLFGLLRDAGLGHPVCRGDVPIDGGPTSPFYEWFAETIRSVAPKLVALGLTTAEDLDIETLEARLREEVRQTGGCWAGPMMVGAFARKP